MISHVLTDAPVAALTFDDGPHPEYTPRVLEVLGRFDVRATFFMVGEAAARQPELVKQVASRHVIANHSWDHPVFTKVAWRERRRQLHACSAALAPHESRLFRPPHGAVDRASELDVWALGYQTVGWSVDAEDWLSREPAWMAERLTAHTGPGSIVLLHDAIYRSLQPVPQYDRTAMLEALAVFLASIGGRLRFVSVPELLGYGTAVSSSPF